MWLPTQSGLLHSLTPFLVLLIGDSHSSWPLRLFHPAERPSEFLEKEMRSVCPGSQCGVAAGWQILNGKPLPWLKVEVAN